MLLSIIVMLMIVLRRCEKLILRKGTVEILENEVSTYYIIN